MRIGSHESVQIDLLREGDLPAALRIQEAEHWNHIAPDWIRLLRLNPQGCFAAFSDGKLIGTVTVITYGERLAWIGMMLVTKEYRGRGVGKQLIRTALDHCQHRHIATVKLDATPAGRPLYESLGFIPENEIERWHGAGSSGGQTDPGPFSTDKAPLSLYWLDEQAFRVSREDLLNSLLGDCCVAPGLHIDESTCSCQGYALARSGARASYIGPVVAVEPEVGLRLLDSMLQRLRGAVFVDVCHVGKDIESQLLRRGFARQRSLTRMSLGQQIPPTSDMVFAIAGPELG